MLQSYNYCQYIAVLIYSNQLLSENKPYSLNSIYNFCALKNLQFNGQKMADSVTDHRACSISKSGKHLAFTVSGGTFANELEWELG